jgi:peptidoglycan/xylan/chitin deacetylase (PgdA/CDA1 family)
MLKSLIAAGVLLSLSATSPSFAQDEHEIAITIDDLPFVAASYKNPAALQRTHDRFMQIIESLQSNQVPATGFVIGSAIGEGDWELLEAFHQAGFTVGNHTYSHLNLNQSSAQKYIDNIARTDKIITPLLSHPKYFRYPYLAEGKGEVKEEVQRYLAENDYVIAPVTIDSKDYRFNEQLYQIPYRARVQHLPQIKARYLAYIWHETERAEKRANGKPVKQILLLHANLLNSYCLNDIIQMYKQHGYRFISLNEALANPAPAITAPANEEPTPSESFTKELDTTKPQPERTF